MAQSLTNSYSGENILNTSLESGAVSPADSLGGDTAGLMPGPNVERHAMRQTLRKNPTDDESSFKGKKNRFSKRHSKSGLAAVF
jgi:3-phosphoinositide dependent protein kinase-1